MNAKILIVALCAVQLASGQLNINGALNTFLSPLVNKFGSLVNDANTSAVLATQQLNGNVSAATQIFLAAIQNATNSIQQYAASASSNTSSAQEQIQACVNQASQSLSALNDTSTQKLETQAASVNAILQSAMQNVTAASTAYQSTLSSVISSFKNCGLMNGLSCANSLVSAATNYLSNVVQGLIDNATQLVQQVLGTSPNSAAQTAATMATPTIQSLQLTAQNAVIQASSYAQQAQTCISNAVAAANATTTTATTPSG